MSYRALKLFAPVAGRAYGDAVSRALGHPLAAHEERVFEDGEHKWRLSESVRDCDVFVVQSVHGDAEGGVDARLLRLLFLVGALRDASAARVTVVAPYLAYSRVDQRNKPRDPVITRYIATMFEALGADGVLTLDVHNAAAYQNAFRCRAEHLEAAALLVDAVLPAVAGRDVTVVSPDVGGIKRADAFRQRLAAALGRPVGAAFAEKYRSGAELRGDALVGDVAGKAAVIVDDMICAGNTIARAARACRDHGATSVLACATHGVFAEEANAVLADAPIDAILVTDTIPPWRIREPRVASRLRCISTVQLVAQAIRRMHEGRSLAELADFDGRTPPA